MALVVFTGGARSGKSAAAQDLARRKALDGSLVTALVFGLVEGDSEMARRVEHHQAQRPDEFELVEAGDSHTALELVRSGSLLLLDCLGTLVGMVMAEEWPGVSLGHELIDAGTSLPDGYVEAVEARVGSLVLALTRRAGDTIVVTNEVGDGVVPAHGSGRLFRDVLGRANRELVAVADASYLVVCGRLVELSSLPMSSAWPED